MDSEFSNYCDYSLNETEDEVDRYIKMHIQVDLKMDPAVWWEENKNQFPKLSKLAKAIHAIPASSTPSERGFSCAGSVIVERRVCLDPNALEDTLILWSTAKKFEANCIWNQAVCI